MKYIFTIVILFATTFCCGYEVDPVFFDVEPIRSENRYSETLNEIEARMPSSHIYRDSDKTTHSHECSHGLCSRLRIQNEKKYGTNETLYVLEGKSVLIIHPRIKISDVATRIPSGMRGTRYKLYLLDQQRYWNNEPIYLCEEWICYVNGGIVGYEYGLKDRTADSIDASLEFFGYCLYMMKIVKELDPKYDDRQLRAFIMWHGRRVSHIARRLYEEKILWSRSCKWYERINTSAETASLRQFCLQYFGKEWCKEAIGFIK